MLHVTQHPRHRGKGGRTERHQQLNTEVLPASGNSISVLLPARELPVAQVTFNCNNAESCSSRNADHITVTGGEGESMNEPAVMGERTPAIITTGGAEEDLSDLASC